MERTTSGREEAFAHGLAAGPSAGQLGNSERGSDRGATEGRINSSVKLGEGFNRPAHKQVFNILVITELQTQTTVRHRFTFARVANIFKKGKWQVLARVWRNWDPHTSLV